MFVIFQWVENLRKDEEGKLLLCKQMTEKKSIIKEGIFFTWRKLDVCIHCEEGDFG